MNYQIVPQKRNFQAHLTNSFPEGVYIDSTTGEIFASTAVLAYLLTESSTTIQEFVESDPVRRDAVAIVPGAVSVRVHPESTIQAAIKEYEPDLAYDSEQMELEHVLEGLRSLIVDFSDDETQTHWTLHEWMVSNCLIVLEAKLFNKLVSRVHCEYKYFYRKSPKTEYRPQVNNPKQVKKLQVYSRDEFPVLHMCYMKTLLENCFK